MEYFIGIYEYCFLHMITTIKTIVKQITGMAIPYYFTYFNYKNLLLLIQSQYYHVNKNFCARKAQDYSQKNFFK